MDNGLYIADFKTPLDQSSGVIMIQDGKVYGGDSGMYYFGSVEDNGKKIIAQITVKQHNPVSQSVFGDIEEFDLTLEGKSGSDPVIFNGRATRAPSLRFEATLTKAVD
ncbi:GrlR family regulatory protein [Woodsholea maritima]|uniref:GrlR family regulatory protein n=1 Tax=Woodsholea maritima TaxID=240237 RepID=UPI00037DB98D|nr:GrlR family regulatory protein [Woodsholea maritima]